MTEMAGEAKLRTKIDLNGLQLINCAQSHEFGENQCHISHLASVCAIIVTQNSK